MELNIVNPAEIYMHRAFGITDQRRTEIMKNLDKLMATIPDPSIIIVHELMNEIAKLCDTQEELVLAIFHNVEWMFRNRKIKMLAL